MENPDTNKKIPNYQEIFLPSVSMIAPPKEKILPLGKRLEGKDRKTFFELMKTYRKHIYIALLVLLYWAVNFCYLK